MEQLFLCAACGEENEVFLDPQEGNGFELVQDCRVCCQPNVIRARYNFYSNEFDLEVYREDMG